MREQIDHVLENIATACRKVERSGDDVTLIAVSKTFDADAIRPALEAGHRVFGENRVQESQGKWPVEATNRFEQCIKRY